MLTALLIQHLNLGKTGQAFMTPGALLSKPHASAQPRRSREMGAKKEALEARIAQSDADEKMFVRFEIDCTIVMIALRFV